ncbi:MAG: PrsW family intramembrane metalloprotease, partial [Anaerolineales bacterium]|nr:PrsW family intramembrane metalloprotease [Anaerolineales bacterium]
MGTNLAGFLVSTLAGMIPMLVYAWFLYTLDRYEKEPLKLLLGVFAWGSVVAAGAAYIINSLSSMGLYLITQSDFTARLTLSTLVAPIVEETLKGAAVFIVFLLFRSEFDSLLDGIVYAGITALGFAATENIWYIHKLGFLESGWQGIIDLTLIRIVIVGWQHPFYTAFIGLGFAIARRSTRPAWKWIAPIIGWSTAVIFHLQHYLFAGLLNSKPGMIFSTAWDWSGYLGLFILVLFLIKREQTWMKEYLEAEYNQEILTSDQYKTACSAFKQTAVYLKARIQGNYSETRRFYQACGDLMHKKRQL